MSPPITTATTIHSPVVPICPHRKWSPGPPSQHQNPQGTDRHQPMLPSPQFPLAPQFFTTRTLVHLLQPTADTDPNNADHWSPFLQSSSSLPPAPQSPVSTNPTQASPAGGQIPSPSNLVSRLPPTLPKSPSPAPLITALITTIIFFFPPSPSLLSPPDAN